MAKWWDWLPFGKSDSPQEPPTSYKLFVLAPNTNMFDAIYGPFHSKRAANAFADEYGLGVGYTIKTLELVYDANTPISGNAV